MKKYKKLGYIFLIIIIVMLSVTVYATVSKDTDKIEKDKKIAEVKFLEDKLLNVFNQLNDIDTRNYNVSVNNITKQLKNQDEAGSNNEQGESKSESSNSTSNSTTSKSKQEKEFDLKNNGVLTSADEINWDNIKSQIEILYTSISTITLDLYQSNINQDDILNFNKEFDNLTVGIKQENKQMCLDELSKLYNYLPNFSQNILDDEIEKTLVETKNNILKAYSKLDSKNWREISENIKQASNSFSKLLTNTNIDTNKQYSINKIYIMINELQNAISVQDETIFLIKYKNILEEMNSIK